MSDTIRASVAAVVAAVTIVGLIGCGTGPMGTGSGLEDYNGDWVYESFRTRSPEGRLFEFVGLSRDISLDVMDEVTDQGAIWPERFSLQIDDSVFRVSGGTPGPDFTLPVDGGPGRVSGQEKGDGIGIRLVWRGRRPVVERLFPENSRIVDRYDVTSEGMLVITRTIRMERTTSKNPLEIVYRRDGQLSGVDAPR